MICAAVGCADNTIYEPEKPMLKKMSHEVTQAEARKNLEKFIANIKTPATRGGEQRSLPPITSVYTTGKPAEATRSGEAVEPHFHIFNFGNNEGYAIMSGDDRVEPLLALTFKGELTPETEIDNPGFEIAYSRMEDYYVAKTMGGPSIDIDIPIPPKDSIQRPGLELPARFEIDTVEVYRSMQYGYCPVDWDQINFNRYCYVPNTVITAPTGCVATAMAQLMAIYRFPNSYNGYTFNWNYMIQSDQYTEGKNQVCRLMQQLGLSNNLNTQYSNGSNGSWASPNNIAQTFVNFGYANGGTTITYSTPQVVQELRNGYPILISGKEDPSDNMGHIWLGHGLMELRVDVKEYNEFDEIMASYSNIVNYYILCNFGFDAGNANGYYLSGVFCANEGPAYPSPTRGVIADFYQYDLEAIVNIRKN